VVLSKAGVPLPSIEPKTVNGPLVKGQVVKGVPVPVNGNVVGKPGVPVLLGAGSV